MDNKEEKKIIRQEFLTGERALFMGKNLDIYDTIFDDGESPLKESCGINLYGSRLCHTTSAYWQVSQPVSRS